MPFLGIFRASLVPVAFEKSRQNKGTENLFHRLLASLVPVAFEKSRQNKGSLDIDILPGGGPVWIRALEWGSRGRGFESRPPDVLLRGEIDNN